MFGKKKGDHLSLCVAWAISLLFAQASVVWGLDKNMNDSKSKASPIDGTWQGAVSVGAGMELPLVFHINSAGTAFSGTFDSPAQGTTGINFDSVTFCPDGKLSVAIDKLKAHYEGKLDSSKQEITGIWFQGGAQIPLNMKAVEKYVAPARPQEPKPPFPYKTQEVSLKTGDIVIEGVLTLPQGDGPFPAVVLIHGSGPHDRDETIFVHKPFFLLADFLTRKGIAVLRYDKRGCNKSGGNFRNSTSKDFADDASTAFSYLETLPQIDKKRIGLMGHSEGGMVAPMVAAENSKVGFIISLAGSSLTGEKILVSQIIALAAGQKANKEESEKALEIAKETYKIIKEQPDDKLAIEELKAMRKAHNAQEYSGSEKERKEAEGAVEGSLKVLTGPWYRFFITYDPSEAWSKVHCPVLALNGSLDQQVIAAENISAIETALKKGGNNNFTGITVPGVNHLFQTCKTGLPSEYAEIEETMSPKVLTTISDWISKLSTKN